VLSQLVPRLDLDSALRRASSANDLLPPREDDNVGGELGRRFLQHLREQLENGRYAPDPASFVQVPKPGFTSRPAALLTLTDRVVYEALVELVRPGLAKSLVDDSVVLWPREQSVRKRWREFERNPITGSAPHIVQADVAGFYESLDHQTIREALVHGTGDRPAAAELEQFLAQIMRARKGVPQGLTASDVLATAYLQPVDAAMVRNGFAYWRHGDDVRIAAENYTRAREAIAIFEDELRRQGLLISSGKCAIVTRKTYSEELETWEASQRATREILLATKIEQLTADKKGLAAEMEKANLDEQWGWDLFYHGRIHVEDVIAELREHLEPTDIEVAERIFVDTTNRAPDRPGALRKEEFHQRLVNSLTRLAAGRSPAALSDCASLAARFPEKTETICGYLHSMMESHAGLAVAQIEDLLRSSDYATPWQLAWLLRTLARAVGEANQETLNLVGKLAQSERVHWIVRAEGMKVLGHAGRLPMEEATQAWRLAPRVYRSDLIAAVSPMAECHDWAKRLLSVSNLDPVEKVIVAHLRARNAVA
jgi:hypothetical protein